MAGLCMGKERIQLLSQQALKPSVAILAALRIGRLPAATPDFLTNQNLLRFAPDCQDWAEFSVTVPAIAPSECPAGTSALAVEPLENATLPRSANSLRTSSS